jgi:hypothetical protein
MKAEISDENTLLPELELWVSVTVFGDRES